MKLIIIGDTHIPDRGDCMPSAVIKEITTADLIVHAGDFTSLEFYNKLKEIKPLKAVRGNMDCSGLQETLREKEIFEIEKYKIGLIHGFGTAGSVLSNVKKKFDDSFDLVIFGHSHTALCEKDKKTIFFNPGSPTDKIFTSENTFGVIEIDNKITTRIIKL